MNEQDGVGAGETLLFPCGGAAYSGQVTHQTALVLARQGRGQLFCLAAVAAGIADKRARTRRAGRRVAVDGCEDHCARRTLELAGMPVDEHLDLSTLGIGKAPEQPDLEGDARRAADVLGGRWSEPTA